MLPWFGVKITAFTPITNPTSKSPPLYFEETRTQPFLEGTADDYFVAIARFTVQTGGTLPVFIPAIDTTQSDPNQTVYTITLAYRDQVGVANIIYTPQPTADPVASPLYVASYVSRGSVATQATGNKDISGTTNLSTQGVVVSASGGQDLSGNYYNVYNYQDWIAMVNTALGKAHTQLFNKVKTAYPTDGFAGTDPSYTEIITMANKDGAPATSVTISSTTAPSYPLGTTNYFVCSDGSVLQRITTKPSTAYLTVYTIYNTDSHTNLSTATNITTSAPRDPVGTTTLTNSDFQTVTFTTVSSPATFGAVAPFMQIDLTTLTCVLNADSLWYNSNTIGISGQTGTIYFNTRLYELFAGFPFKFFGYSGDQNYQILTTSNNYSNILSVSNQGTGTTQKYLQAFQEINSVGLWNPIASVVFTSTTLPIHPTLSSAPKIYNSVGSGLQGVGSTNLTNILSDFEFPISSTNQYRPEISYVPQGEYRLIDMYSNRNLSKIDLNVYWRDRYGNLKPVRLLPGCSASVKILFRHKHFYLGTD